MELKKQLTDTEKEEKPLDARFVEKGIVPTLIVGRCHTDFQTPLVAVGNVLDSQKLTNQQSKPISDTIPIIKTLEMQQKLTPLICQTLICSVEDSHANLFLLLEKDRVSKILEELYSMKYLESSRLNSQDYSSWKMSKGSFQQTMDGALLRLSPVWMNWGIMLNGRFLTARILECRKTEKGCSLSDILEPNPPDKYFLSEKATRNLKKQLEEQHD